MSYHFISYDIGTREGISTNEKYAGGFNKITGPTSNLLPDDHPRTSKYSGERCVNYYLKQGATPRKLVLGMPLYGTGWNGTEGMYTDWTSESSASLFPVYLHPPPCPKYTDLVGVN